MTLCINTPARVTLQNNSSEFVFHYNCTSSLSEIQFVVSLDLAEKESKL